MSKRVYLQNDIIFSKENGLTSAYFNTVGKVELDNDLLKLWYMKKATMSLFSLITLTGISLFKIASLDLPFRVLMMFDRRIHIQKKNLDYLVLTYYI